MKYFVGAVGALFVVAAVLLVLGYLFLVGIRGGHTAELDRPHVTAEPVDQKKNMGLYDDAKGPGWADTPYVGVVHMPFGVCYKTGVVIAEDEHGNNIYAGDDEVIWRCLQTHPTGELIPRDQAPMVYCHVQREQARPPAKAWRCYHDYSVVFSFYEHDYGKSPLILPDEIEYIDTTRFQ